MEEMALELTRDLTVNEERLHMKQSLDSGVAARSDIDVNCSDDSQQLNKIILQSDLEQKYLGDEAENPSAKKEGSLTFEMSRRRSSLPRSRGAPAVSWCVAPELQQDELEYEGKFGDDAKTSLGTKEEKANVPLKIEITAMMAQQGGRRTSVTRCTQGRVQTEPVKSAAQDVLDAGVSWWCPERLADWKVKGGGLHDR